MTKKERPRKRKPPPEPEHTLLATVKSVTVSYFIEMRGDDRNRITDEAATDVLCEIVSIEPKMSRVGKKLICQLGCSREYRRVDDPDEKRAGVHLGKGYTVPDMPFLLSMGLGKDGGGFMAYLPEVVYWALQADLKSGRLKFIQANFQKRGGFLTNIYFSETPPEDP